MKYEGTDLGDTERHAKKCFQAKCVLLIKSQNFSCDSQTQKEGKIQQSIFNSIGEKNNSSFSLI